jgi:O-antigen/teichoic acid export membrane protein
MQDSIGISDLTQEAPLRKRTARAALASGGAEIVTRILTIALSIVTARMLEPREVGLLGLAVIIIAVISIVGFYPETAAVAARGTGTDNKYAIAATAIRATVLCVLILLFRLTFHVLAVYLTGKDDGASELGALVSILIWSPVAELAGGYPQVVLQRRLDLSYIAGVQLLQPIVFVGLAVVLLLWGHGYLGVAWANLIATVVATTLLWLRLWWRRLLVWEGWPSVANWREMIGGSAKVFLGGFGGFLGERVDNLLVAGAIGPAAMSFYSMAWNASRTPANVFARAISFVLVPTIARIHEDRARVQRALRECLRHCYFLLTPVCAAIFVSAPLLVSFVLGPRWLPLVPCLRIMIITVLVAPFLHVANALLIGSGRAQLTGVGTVVHLAILIGLVPFFASRWGIVGAAYAEMTASVALTAALLVIAQRVTRQMNRSITSAVVLPIAASLCAGALAMTADAYVPSDLVRLIVELGLILICYPLLILLLGGRARLFDLTGLLRGVLRRQALAAE